MKITKVSGGSTTWKDLFLIDLGVGVAIPLAIGILGVIWGENVPRDKIWFAGMRANDILVLISLGFFIATLVGLGRFVLELVKKLAEPKPLTRSVSDTRISSGPVYLPLPLPIRLGVESILEKVRAEVPEAGKVAAGKANTSIEVGLQLCAVHFNLEGEALKRAKELFQKEITILFKNKVFFEVHGMDKPQMRVLLEKEEDLL